MANEFYITAGLIAIDSADIGSVGTNAFYMTAGLVAGDRAAEEEGSIPGNPFWKPFVRPLGGVL